MISDNTSTDMRKVRIFQKPIYSCLSHQLTLEVNSMFNSVLDMKRTVDAVKGTMRAAKKIKNAKILRNLTNYSPVLYNEAR